MKVASTSGTSGAERTAAQPAARSARIPGSVLVVTATLAGAIAARVAAETAKVAAQAVTTPGMVVMASNGPASSGPSPKLAMKQACKIALARSRFAAGTIAGTRASRAGVNTAAADPSASAKPASASSGTPPRASAAASPSSRARRIRSAVIISRRRSCRSA